MTNPRCRIPATRWLALWCVALFLVFPGIAAATTGTGTTSHTGSLPGNHLQQGGTGTLTFSLLNNGAGATSGTLTVVVPLPNGLTFGTLPTGSPWNCTAQSGTLAICTNVSAIAQGSSYQALTLPVNVAVNAAASVTVSGATFSGAGMTAGTFSADTISVDPPPLLSMSKTHSGTFTQGATATWNLQVTNSASAAGLTDGSTVTVVDTLPTGYTAASVNGLNWTCVVNGPTVTCTSTQVVAGGAAFPLIVLVANIPANAATSVTNTAKVFGGGDLTHPSLATAASGFDTATVAQVPFAINLTAGNNQVATVNTAFATALTVTVVDAGGAGIAGQSVRFTAPPAGITGKFAIFMNTTTATTNASGLAVASTFTASAAAGGPYSVLVTSGALTNNFSLTNGSTPIVSTNPADAIVNVGDTATFTASGSGVPAPTAQWQSSTDGGGTFQDVAGATSSTLTIPRVTAAQNGTKYRAAFTNFSGTVMTTAATLRLLIGEVDVTRPVNGSVVVSFTFPGLSGQTYHVQSTDSLTPAIWADRATGLVNSAGKFSFTDSPALPATRFYRATFP